MIFREMPPFCPDLKDESIWPSRLFVKARYVIG